MFFVIHRQLTDLIRIREYDGMEILILRLSYVEFLN
jgi:hypothetical protein